MIDFIGDVEGSDFLDWIGSVWISNETRLEHFSEDWRAIYYPSTKLDRSGLCLSLVRGRDDTFKYSNCTTRKSALCKSNEKICQSSILSSTTTDEAIITTSLPEGLFEDLVFLIIF